MKKRYFQILILLSLTILFFATNVIAQEVEKAKDIIINSVVKDENGNPIKGAIIYGNEGAIVAKTDNSGNFAITVPVQTDLLIESDGYEPALFKAGELLSLKAFSLKSSIFMYSAKDAVNIAFGKVKKGDIVNAVSVLEPKDILKYDNIESVSDALNGRIPGLLGSSNIRGIGNALFIVDGFPRDISTINIAEVDQITVLKDINSSIMYGSAAANGVVLITTKRGEAFKKQFNVTGYYGVSSPISLPKYLSSADYMQLYNEARENDGLPAPYSADMIANYRTGNKYLYPNVDYYSNEFLKSIKPFTKVMTEVSGGNSVATYYSNLGWEQTGSLLNFGEGESAKQNKINVRGNIDLNINSWIKSAIDVVGFFNNTTGPVGKNYWSAADSLHPNLFAPLIPINMINPNNALLLSRKNDVNGQYLLGGAENSLTNPIADGYSGGTNENIQSTFSFNNRIDFDLKRLVDGLSFHTNLSFDFSTSYNQAVKNAYSVYQPIWNSGGTKIDSLVQYGKDSRPGVQVVGQSIYQRRLGFYGMFDYDKTFNSVHHISSSLLGYGTFERSSPNIGSAVLGYGSYYQYSSNLLQLQPDKNTNLSLRVDYGYKKKYLVDFSSAYVSSAKLPDNNRTTFSPSMGLAWVISSEDFMPKNSAIDYLKLRVSGGIMNSDIGINNYYLYDDIYGQSGGYAWDDGSYSNSGTIATVGPNPNLFFEKRKEINLGLEGIFFNHLLTLDANVFTKEYSDKVSKVSSIYPSFYTDFIPNINYDKYGYHGGELGLSIYRKVNDISFTVGANVLYSDSKILKMDESYKNAYQNRVGRPVDAIYGLVSEGFFTDQADIDKHAVQAFGSVQPGDIKYVDQNKDGVIDANDQVQIGRSQAPFSYGLNLKISYKSFTLFALGYGNIGGDGYISGSYYQISGDMKYSTYILNRWTEATKTTATYPRLSSLSNSNNFQTSSFWLYRNNYFDINRIQLTYNLPDPVAQMLKMKKLDLFVNGSSLLLISKYQAIDQLVIGSEPNYRSFSVGLKAMF